MSTRYLSDLDMPSLTSRHRRSTHLLARVVLLKERPAALAHLQLAASFLRTVDFAYTTYRMARSQLAIFSAERAVNGFFDGISALETCLTETHRAVRFGTALSRSGVIMPDGSPVVPRTARSGVLSARTATRIGRLRNSLQHLDERILEGDLGLPQAFGPRPEATSLSVGRMRVEYTELAEWLIELDNIAARVQYITRCADRSVAI